MPPIEMSRIADKSLRIPPLLVGIDECRRRRLLAESSTQTFPPRSIVFTEGGTANHLHILTDGLVELYAKSGDREATITIVRPGTPFILAAVVKDAVMLMSARAIERSRILFLRSATFREALHEDPALALNVSAELGTGWRTMVKHIRDQKLRSSKQRLAAYIVRLAHEQKQSHTIKLPLKKRVLASLLGVEPASLSRAFTELRAAGVEIHHNQIAVGDLAALEEIARSNWPLDDPRS